MMKEYLEVLGKELCGLAKHCEEIVKDAYGDADITFPIDICKVATSLGIEIVPGTINVGKINYITELRFEIDKESNTVKKTIIVDENYHPKNFRYTELERFAIAREIGKTIINSEEYGQVTASSINKVNMLSSPYPVISSLIADSEEFLYEICAMFLLFPMNQFLSEFSETLNFYSSAPAFITNGNMIEEVSKKAKIPYYQFVNNYSLMKLCAHQYIENAYQDGDKQLVQKYGNLIQ